MDTANRIRFIRIIYYIDNIKELCFYIGLLINSDFF